MKFYLGGDLKIRITVVMTVLLLFSSSYAARFLFDATKAEMAGNADWVIDADSHNLGVNSSSHLMQSGAGNESNPQRYPTPAASGITQSTSETYWDGALSSWAVELVKRGHAVETLPYNVAITYGNSSNVQDLGNYDVFIVCEPNILFSTTEKTAVLNFVRNGGGLFMIADHNGSDRNNDGEDSPHVWNDLMQTNSVQTNPFGITYNYDDVSPDTRAVDSTPSDSIIHGAAGTCTELNYSDGSTITMNTVANSSVRGAIWTSSSHTSSNAMVAYATFSNGKVVGIGDSSPCDDGTGDSNDQLYTGWTEVSGNHAILFINASLWLAARPTNSVPEISYSLPNEFALPRVYPNPFNAVTTISFALPKVSPVRIEIYDALGRTVTTLVSSQSQEAGRYNVVWNAQQYASGIYFCRMETPGLVQVNKMEYVR